MPGVVLVRHHEKYREEQLADPAHREIPTTIDAFRRVALTPLSSLGDDFIEFPGSWLPAGTYQRLRRRSFRISDYRPEQLPERTFPQHELTLRQILYAMWYLPRAITGRHGKAKPIAPSTYCLFAQILISMARWSLTNRYHESTLFAHLSVDDVRTLARLAHHGELVVRLLWRLGALKYISDVPTRTSEVPVHMSEPDRRDVMPAPPAEPERTPFQPFPDAFISELGWRCMWFVENLGPDLLQLEAECNSPALLALPRRERNAARNKIVQGHVWHDCQKRVIDLPPYLLYTEQQKDEAGPPRVWPPPNYRSLAVLVGALQSAHFVLLALSIGARDSELKACRADSVTESSDDRASSKTYKLGNQIGGVAREFPLPPLAVRAMLQQSCLAQLYHHKPDGPLFVIRSNNKRSSFEKRGTGDEHTHSNEMLTRLVTLFGLWPLLDGTSPHTHRFRKTLARLIGLALIDAPKILFDLFGHENMQQTMYYMLSDKQIMAELVDVANRMAHAMTGDILANLDSASGPAAPKLQQAMQSFRIQSGKERFDTETIDEAVEVLSIVGVPFKVVLPDVICTKQPHQIGACDPESRDPNPALCKPYCDHRLERGSARAQVEKTISYLCEKLQQAEQMSQMVRANWEGQLLHHLHRFEDVRARWLAFSKVAADVWATRVGADRA